MKYSVLKTLQKACLSRLHLQLDTTPIQCTMYKCPGFPWCMHKNQANYDICRSKNVKMCIDHNFQLGNGCFISFLERILITARLIIIVMVEWDDDQLINIIIIIINWIFRITILPLVLSLNDAVDGRISGHQRREN